LTLKGGLALDLKRMSRVLAVDAEAGGEAEYGRRRASCSSDGCSARWLTLGHCPFRRARGDAGRMAGDALGGLGRRPQQGASKDLVAS
jgi:hypothetical protein